jgi:hypothetical protein
MDEEKGYLPVNPIVAGIIGRKENRNPKVFFIVLAAVTVRMVAVKVPA